MDLVEADRVDEQQKDKVKVRFLGSGDNFGAGARLQTCIMVQSAEGQFLIDCGATALVSMQKFGVNPGSINLILLTHLHGDHFGGLPFFILNEQFSKRTAPVLIAGPRGTEQRLKQAMEVFFPGSSQVPRKYSVDIMELEPETTRTMENLTLSTFPAEHYSGAPSLMLRVEYHNRIIVYTGDTQWNEHILQASRNADLLICESYFYEKKIKYHMDYKTLLNHRDEIGAKKIILTHMGRDMLSHLDEVVFEHAFDGKQVEI